MTGRRKFKGSKWLVLFLNIACIALACLFVNRLAHVWFDPAGVHARDAASAGPVTGSQPDQSGVAAQDYKK